MRTLIRFVISALVFIGFLLHVSDGVRFQLLTQIENFSYDARILLTLKEGRDDRVVILNIDERSLEAEGQWQWPRDLIGKMVVNLFDHYQVRALGFDMAFPEQDRTSGTELFDQLRREAFKDDLAAQQKLDQFEFISNKDAAFAEALRGRSVVLGAAFKNVVSERDVAEVGVLGPPVFDESVTSQFNLKWLEAEGYSGNVPILQGAAPHMGFFDNPLVDADGLYRQVPLLQKYQGQVYPSLALQLARAALGNPPVQLGFDPPEARGALNIDSVRIGELKARVGEQLSVFVPYRGPAYSFEYVSATDVIRKNADPEILRDAIVLFGTDAPGLYDLRSTPVGAPYPGVEVHANIVSGLLNGTIKQRAPYYTGIEVMLMLIIGALVAWLFPKVSPLAGAGLVMVLMGAITGMALVLWSSANFIMPLGTLLVYVLALFLVHVLYGYFVESRGKRGVQKLFGQYIPPELVEEMAEAPDSVSMEGESRNMSVLFSDVRGFTTISEGLDAPELSQLMNEFLTPLTRVIHEHRGTIDKYMGDAIMAFWGAPLADEQHAVHSLEAGLEMTRAVRELDAPFEQRGWPKIKIGVGINTGEMRVGNMGSEFRMAYTVMGDAVNLGSRLEGLTKGYGVEFICSESTRLAGPSDWAFRELDRVTVKGKKEPVTIYEPLGPKEALDADFRQDVARHRGALKAYREQNWDVAEREWTTLQTSPRPHLLYEVYLARIKDLRANPPGKDWDGVFEHKTK